MYICVTHVDAITGIPCDVEPMRTGPSLPDVKGLMIQWFNQTDWPTEKPLLYGTCDDDADPTIEGVVSVLSEQDYNILWDTEKANVENQTRDRRNKLLAETDWVVIMHTEKGTNIPLEWEAYRQALRDITTHVNFPHLAESDWPDKPE